MSNSGWEIRMSKSRGVPYFFNTETNKSTWEIPSDLKEDDLHKLPGAHLMGESAEENHAGQVRASHLLIKHRDSRRPSSWKETTITRSKGEATQILRGFEAQINGSPDKFAELAAVHSDCSSHSHGGDLGWFGHGQMQKPFEDAAFGLEVGKISEIISSDSGVHLVLRTG